MGKYVLIFEDKKLPPTANKYKRMNKWQVKREREYWIEVIRSHMRKNPPPLPLDRYKLTLVRCSSVEPDFDGLVLSFKVVVDAMQEQISKNTFGAGLTTGDKMENTGVWDCKWIKAPPKKGSIVVKVESEIEER